jgi:hypothetical protein
MLKMPVPSLQKEISTVANRLFLLVSQYAGAGDVKGDNATLLSNAFKVLNSYTFGSILNE